ncbi:DUF397 domain-containing protein [Actinocorallia sp. A-T 12471]|uniref:DUF397 domain-containing protein n=1 Tax=Actinocorallia sp. A-T 12471 TaxID=3089813 RepID=UPI0029D024A5|nr:DUF397 domain-containing protein [Actinocorallia sp. A-T 12471]MDX6741727.1 DUF397 domain-containing protein [Actinocorallia sp. A-T 12471]
MNPLNWRKSSYSNATGDACVELANLRGHVGIRDSKNPNTAPLTVTRSQLSHLTTRIRTNTL